jgi:hypothetical protein
LQGVAADQLVNARFSQESGPIISYLECPLNDLVCPYPSISFDMPSCPTVQDTFTFKLSVMERSGGIHNGTHLVKLNCPSDGDNDSNTSGQKKGDDDDSN